VAARAEQKAFSPAAKALLAGEILATYGRVRWWLLRGDLPSAVRAARNGTVPQAAKTRDRAFEQLLGLRLGRAVSRTLGVFPADSRCLVRSLVLTRLLARRGIDSSLVIGVSVEPRFAAHAWVESGDVPLLPTNGSTFARLVRL
jgi:Transglutaminase-like superfamily